MFFSNSSKKKYYKNMNYKKIYFIALLDLISSICELIISIINLIFAPFIINNNGAYLQKTWLHRLVIYCLIKTTKLKIKI